MEVGIAEAAAQLGVSIDTVRRRIKRGQLQARQDKTGRYFVTLKDAGETPAPDVDVLRDLAVAQAELALVTQDRDRLYQLLQAEQSARAQSEHELHSLLLEAVQAARQLPAPSTQDTTQTATPTPTQKRTRLFWKK